MNQSQAIAKLRKAIGKSFAYRIDPKAPDAEERERRRQDLINAREARAAAEAARAARREAVLAADAEYQRLKAEHEAAKQRLESLPSANQYRITVGSDRGWCFLVQGQGDNWAEVVEKVCAKVSA